MTVILTQMTTGKAESFCNDVSLKSSISIRDLSKITGNLVASSPAVTHELFSYQELENLNISALEKFIINHESLVSLSKNIKQKILYEIFLAVSQYMLNPSSDITIYTVSGKNVRWTTDDIKPIVGN